MVNIDLNGCVVYVPDYRSPPSGLGTISVREEKNILIQDLGCNPIVDDDRYDEVLCIDYNLSKDVYKGYEALIGILLDYGVDYVFVKKYFNCWIISFSFRCRFPCFCRYG